MAEVLDFEYPLHAVVYCLFLFMFFLFARKAQFVPESLAGDNLKVLVARSHVCVSQDKVLVTFYKTKTRQTGGKPLVIPLPKIPGSVLCPVAAFDRMCRLVPAQGSSPLFILPPSYGSVPIVYSTFQKVLRACVSSIGLSPHSFSSHSFRRGGASFAFGLGVPGEMIQSQGDWASECYKLYVDVSLDHRCRVADSMAKYLAH